MCFQVNSFDFIFFTFQAVFDHTPRKRRVLHLSNFFFPSRANLSIFFSTPSFLLKWCSTDPDPWLRLFIILSWLPDIFNCFFRGLFLPLIVLPADMDESDSICISFFTFVIIIFIFMNPCSVLSTGLKRGVQ